MAVCVQAPRRHDRYRRAGPACGSPAPCRSARHDRLYRSTIDERKPIVASDRIERHTAHGQPSVGTPMDVPVPRKSSSAETGAATSSRISALGCIDLSIQRHCHCDRSRTAFSSCSGRNGNSSKWEPDSVLTSLTNNPWPGSRKARRSESLYQRLWGWRAVACCLAAAWRASNCVISRKPMRSSNRAASINCTSTGRQIAAGLVRNHAEHVDALLGPDQVHTRACCPCCVPAPSCIMADM